jgi:amino acid permease
MDFIIENGVPILEIAAQIVGAFAILATMTKNDADNKIVAWLLKIINIFGANLGRARNSD